MQANVNPFVMYNRLVGSVSSSSSAFVDVLQATFNLTGALTATTALGTTALVLAPPIGVAIACVGTVAFKVFSLVKDNDDFKEVLEDILFVMKQLERIDPCPTTLPQTESCQFVSRHFMVILDILKLFVRLPQTIRIKSLTPSQFTSQLIRELTLLNTGLTIMLLDAKSREPVEALAVMRGEEMTDSNKKGGGMNLNDPIIIEQATRLLRETDIRTDEIIRQNMTQGGRKTRKTRKTRNNRRKKNRRTRRNKRR